MTLRLKQDIKAQKRTGGKELALLPKWGAIYLLKSLWDLKSEITSLHFTDFTLVKVISL
jgi:hypothetical protein